MKDRMNESLSAILDNQANELELERVLAQCEQDPVLRQTWVRYNLAQQAAHGHSIAHADWDVSARVRSALGGPTVRDTASLPVTFKHSIVRPLMSFAVAASVAATVVIGGQQLAQLSSTGSQETDRYVSVAAAPVGMVNSLGASAVQASYGTQPIPVLQPATRKAYQQLAQQRLRKYMQEHAEQAALNSPQGLVPFARVPQIRE